MKTAVVSLMVGEGGRAMADISFPLLRRYARKIGADFHYFRGDRESAFPCGEKFRYGQLYAHYDRLCCIDADCVVSWKTMPNLFDVVPEDKVGALDGWAAMTDRGIDVTWIQKEVDELCRSEGEPPMVMDFDFNSGVVVSSKCHRHLYNPPKKPFHAYHCSEQWQEVLNMRRHGYETFPLPMTFNWMWFLDKAMPSLAARPDIHVRHFAGMTVPPLNHQASRIRAMEEAAAAVRAAWPL